MCNLTMEDWDDVAPRAMLRGESLYSEPGASKDESWATYEKWFAGQQEQK